MRGKMAVGFMAASRSTGARQHAKTLKSIDPGLIIVRVAPFRRPLDTFYQQLSSTPRNRVGKQTRSAVSLNLPEAYFTREPLGSPLILLTALPCCAYAPVSVFFFP
jgi:hypothetical protein